VAQPRRNPDTENAKVVAFKEAQARARRNSRPALDSDSEKRRIRSNVAALIFAGILIAVGWILVQKLGQSARMQDCLMSGRTNCAPIAVPAPE
jgi:hypothetical protein